MRFRIKTAQERLAPYYEWHTCFAWFPTLIEDNTWVWLEHYETRLINTGDAMGYRVFNWERRFPVVEEE